MPPLVREPFFLKGRTNVAQRAVLMSAALTAGAMIAAWGLAIAATLMQSLGQTVDLLILMFLAWPPLITLFVFGPLQVLFRRTWKGVLGAILGWYMAMLAFIGVFMLMIQSRFHEYHAALIAFPVTAAIAGLALLRNHRIYWGVWGISIGSALVAGFVLPAAEASRGNADEWLGPELAMMVGRAAIFGSWLCTLSVPWGIPFWWPPASENASRV